MDFVKIRSFDEFKQYSPERRIRLEVEKRIGLEHRHDKKWFTIGYCELCERSTLFELNWFLSKNDIPNYRGVFNCQYCKLPNRKRFMLSYLKKILNNSNTPKNIFMYEAVTHVFNYAKDHFKNHEIMGSEFFGYDKKPGQTVKGIRHEDALNLSLDDNSVDIIVSNDVYEHVPNISLALSEAYRILSDNGLLLISIPFFAMKEITVQRAELSNNNQIEHILPESYHMNPISKDGSLVFYDYGWDFLNFLKQSNFKDAYMLGYYSMSCGYIGNGLQFIFIAEK